MERAVPRDVDVAAAARQAAAILSRDARVDLVYLFGSAADRSRQSPRDVDLALLTRPPLTLDQLTRLRADLVDATGLPLDLVSLNDAPIVLAHEVVDTGECLYARDDDVETVFVTRTRARYWDWAPYREAQWRLSGRRIEERLRGSQA
jgi:uncharacterized protein